MTRSLYRAELQSLLLTLALVLAPSVALFAQERSFAALKAASAEPQPTVPVETASLESLPSAPSSAPGSAAIFAATTMAPASPAPMAPLALVSVPVQPKTPPPHAFWDRQNRVLFTAVAALATADFCATRANLASGGKELNPVTRVFAGSTPGLAANFALETGSVVGLSYLFHKTGHHKLERISALVDIGASGAAAGFSFSHR